MKTVDLLLLPFAYNDIGDPSRATEDRCDKTLAEVPSLTADADRRRVYAALTAGYSKRDPLHPVPERTTSLGEQMAAYMREKPPLSIPFNMYSKPHGWGTLSEMLWAFRIARREWCLATPFVVFTTSHDHLPRVKTYAAFLKPRSWPCRFLSIPHSIGEPWKERAKIVHDLPRLLWLGMKIKSGFDF